MAMTNAERQAKWLSKNRAAFNLRRRNAREAARCGAKGDLEPPTQPSTIEQLRQLVKQEQDKLPNITINSKPQIFRNDYGAVISEAAWQKLQEKKADARKGGYVLDDYSQTV